MAQSINRLNARSIVSISKPGRHADGGNLYLVVDKAKAENATPAKRWVFLYRWNGRLREMGFGSLADIGLARARMLADHARAQLAEGLDPIATRHEQKRVRNSTRSFGEVASELHQARKAGWRNAKVIRQWLTTLKTYAEPIWNKAVDEITTLHVVAVLEPIWATKAETAGRVRGRIEAVIDAARARGMIPDDRANPARWKGHLSHLLPKRPRLQRGHHKALEYEFMTAFTKQLRQRQSMAGLCLEFTILTAARSGEALGARWNEIDESAKLWTVPASRMKARKVHRVPLSDRSLEILREIARLRTCPGAFVFPGQKPGRPLSAMSLEMLLRRMGRAITVHGFRSTFRDWAGDCTSFPREVVEAALAHRVGNEVELAYRRGDALEKRRQLMQAWCSFCELGATSNALQMPQRAP